MLSAAYADLVEETGERLCHVTTEQDEPALPLSSASLDVGCDRLVVGDARGVVWTWDGGVASSRGCDLGEVGRFGGLRRYEALFALVGSREAPRRSGSGRPWACVRAVGVCLHGCPCARNAVLRAPDREQAALMAVPVCANQRRDAHLMHIMS